MTTSILVSLLTVTLSAAAMTEEAQIASGVVSHQNIFHSAMARDVACYRIPALVTTPDGALLAVIDERVPSCADLGKNPNINIVLRRSVDRGATWSPIERVVDYPDGEAASDPSLIVDDVTGRVFLFYNYMDHDHDPDVYHLRVLRSDDNGLTWSGPQDITEQITKPEWRNDFMFITSGRGIRTSTGVLLHTLVNLQAGLHLFGSRDHGETWFLFDHPLLPGDESKVVELTDGTWMVNSRVKGAGMRYVHISRDEGVTWETRGEPALADPACNACIIRYTDTRRGYDKNRLLFANPASPSKRRNMTVRLSYDEGTTWTTEKTIYPGHSAYASLTILDNGDIGLLFEKDDHKENVFVRFTLEWLTDGKDTYTPPNNTP